MRRLALGGRRYELAGVSALLANDLVDAMCIFTVPVVLGSGKKLFADGSAPHSYTLTRSRVSSMGVMIAHCERGGEIKIVRRCIGRTQQGRDGAPGTPKREG